MKLLNWGGLSLGLGFYTTNRIFYGLERDVIDPTLFGENLSSYSLLGEAYLDYTRGNTHFKFGRQRLDTPMAGSDDARSLPSLFEAYMVDNTDIKNLTLTFGHLSKFAAGAFSNVYGGGALPLSSGYGLTTEATGSFINMGKYAYNNDKDTSGVTLVGAKYALSKELSVQLWDYYAYDLFNSIYAQADVKLDMGAIKPFFSAQYINQKDIGDELGREIDIVGEVDVNYFGLKAGAGYGAFNAYVAYSSMSDESNLLTPWGGMAGFTQGMVTRHQFLAGTDATKLAGSYKFDKGSATLYYTSFDMSGANGYAPEHSWTASEAGFDFIYNAMEDLQLRFRGNFPRDFKDGLDWNEYRLIANYNF